MMGTDILTGLLLALLLLTPLVIKWELDKAVTFPAILLIGACAGAVFHFIGASETLPLWIALGLEGVLIVLMAAGLLLWRFFRDPERACDASGREIVAAADGHVVYVKRIEAGEIPVSEKQGRSFSLDEFAETTLLPPSGWLIGTAMTYLDVHVNRSPISGRVRFLKHINGRFFSLKRPEAVYLNERAATVIEGDEMTVGVIQIASRLVRNIIPFVETGEVLAQGQRFGKIRFGSQVDLVVPDRPGLKILVKEGDQLKAGVSVIANY